MTKTFVHPTASVEENVTLGDGVKIWHNCQIRKGAKLGSMVSVGKDSYIDHDVEVGQGSRIQNQVNIYAGVKIGEWCFVGPAVVFTNDMFPRVGNKTWKITETVMETGASIGAGAVIRCGVTVGAFSMIGAGALVTRSVPPFTLVIGHPANDTRRICGCGQSILPISEPEENLIKDCCRENMSPETLKSAEREIAKLIMLR